MKLLLGSGGFRTEERLETLRHEVHDHFGSKRKLLFVPYALADHDAYLRIMREKRVHGDLEIEGIHEHADPAAAVRAADGISVGGGNTFRLTKALWELGLIDVIRERVRGGMPYMGVSAGTNVACPTMQTTNDMPIVQPPTFEALDLVPFQVNAHYYPGQVWIRDGDEFHEHFGETRDTRLKEFHECNERPVLGLWEGGILRIDGDAVRLVGAAARLFQRGEDPVDFEPGSQLPRM